MYEGTKAVVVPVDVEIADSTAHTLILTSSVLHQELLLADSEL